MELLFLGTGAGVPSRQRNVSALALKLLNELNEVWLFDCGEATQHQMLATTLKPRKISTVFITHMHGDHIFGLPGFLSSRNFQGGRDPLTIYGPPGIRQYVKMSLQLSQSKLSYPLHIQELDKKGGSFTTKHGWQVDYLPLNHGILCFGYRITEPDSPGELLVNKLAKYNIPNGPIYGQLKRGERVTLPDGNVLNGKDYIAPDRAGRILTILGDTKPCQNSRRLAEGAHVLVHEGTHGHEESQMAKQYNHSTNVQAALIAKEADVKQLFINHISARYVGPLLQEYIEQVKKVAPHAVVVQDLHEYDILPIEEVPK